MSSVPFGAARWMSFWPVSQRALASKAVALIDRKSAAATFFGGRDLFLEMEIKSGPIQRQIDYMILLSGGWQRSHVFCSFCCGLPRRN